MKKSFFLFFFGLMAVPMLLAQEPVAPPPPPPPPPPSWELSEDIFKVVEEPPMFPGCEDVVDNQERKKCADQKMFLFIFENIRYPEEARKKKVEGMVLISYVIEKDGSITNAKIVRDIGTGCGEQALQVVNTMPKWQPGKQAGRPVRVQFNLPVKFKLE